MGMYSQAADTVMTEKLPSLSQRDGEYLLTIDKVKAVKSKSTGKEYRIVEFKIEQSEATTVPYDRLRPGEAQPIPFPSGSSVAYLIDTTSPYAGREVSALYAAVSGASLEQFTLKNKQEAEQAFKTGKADSLEDAKERFSLVAMADTAAISEKNPLRGRQIKARIERTVTGPKSREPGKIFSAVRFSAVSEGNEEKSIAARRKSLGG